MSRHHAAPNLQARKNAKSEATRREHVDKYAPRTANERVDSAPSSGKDGR